MVRMNRKSKKALVVSEDGMGQTKHVIEFQYQDTTDMQTTWSPQMDIYETDDDLVILVEAAGLREDSLQLHAVNNRLILGGERHLNEEAQISRYHQLEIQFTPFQKTIVLPGKIDEKHVNAEYKNGLLSIRVKKRYIK